MSELLFTPLRVGPWTLRNRIVCLPLYLAYPEPDHEVNDLVLDDYAEMAASGAALVVVENATVAQRPAYCGRWPAERRERFLRRVGG